jgi:hypothetical protein
MAQFGDLTAAPEVPDWVMNGQKRVVRVSPQDPKLR